MKIIFLSVIALILSLANIFLLNNNSLNKVNGINKIKQADNLNNNLAFSPIPSLPPSPTPSTSPSPSPSPTPSPTPIPLKIIFGIGDNADKSIKYKIVSEAPIKMLTSWYNGPGDLEWMRVQKQYLFPEIYKSKFIVHLVTWTPDEPEQNIETPYGPACGRPYPVSTQILEDMNQLSQIYNGPVPMYVSLFTEFQTYTCTDNNWNGNENYWKTLMDNYKKIKDIFHKNAPKSKVSISWGGWINRYDDVENQGGRSLFKYFAQTLKESDFSSFQSMDSDSNAKDIINMVSILGSYKKPVMLSHYKPATHKEDVFNNDMNKIFEPSTLRELIKNGFFAISFMDYEILEDIPSTYQTVKTYANKYGK